MQLHPDCTSGRLLSAGFPPRPLHTGLLAATHCHRIHIARHPVLRRQAAACRRNGRGCLVLGVHEGPDQGQALGDRREDHGGLQSRAHACLIVTVGKAPVSLF